MFRPRSALARQVYDKMYKDQHLKNMDKSQWYSIDEDEMRELSPEVWRKFRQFEIDDETTNFLDNCFETSDSFCWQLWLTVASSILSFFFTPTSINSLLSRGSMYVFSSNQFTELISWNHDGVLMDSLLDIGAGDGNVADKMKKYFNKVYVTEMSRPMKSTLVNKGFTVLDELSWSELSLEFDVITCLNVLDRCDSPITLLGNIKKSLKPNGLAVISLVIPYTPYVEFGDHVNHQPKEKLPIRAKSFNQEVVNLINEVLTPNGWEVIRWTRLPYLCQGDMQQAYYWLSDAVFVIKPTKI